MSSDVKTSEEEADSIYRVGKVTFESLKLPTQLYQNVLCEMKFTTPSKVQAESLPIILGPTHPNFIGQAQAGSGKTGAYSLAILSRVDPKIPSTQAICLVPTRELANQVHGIITQLAKKMDIQTYLAVPVVSTMSKQNKVTISEHVVVGTPGTIINKLKHVDLNASKVFMFVCDEADQMLSLQGLGDQTLQIKNKLPTSNLQVLLFSATFPTHVEKFAAVVAPNAQSVRIKKEDMSLTNVKQFWVETKEGDSKDKYDKLVLLYGLMQLGQSLVFCESIQSAKELCNQLRKDGYAVSILYGKDMKPEERDLVMRDFVTGKTTILIATNVVARGIDVASVNMVVNYEIPVTRNKKPDYETYCHRVGRAGRFGRAGTAINFVASNNEKQQLAQIATFFDKPITELKFDNFEHLENTIRTHINHPSK